MCGVRYGRGAHLARKLDDPGGRHDDAREHAQAALLLDLLHHEARRLVVVRAFTVRARDRHNLLRTTEHAAYCTSRARLAKGARGHLTVVELLESVSTYNILEY